MRATRRTWTPTGGFRQVRVFRPSARRRNDGRRPKDGRFVPICFGRRFHGGSTLAPAGCTRELTVRIRAACTIEPVASLRFRADCDFEPGTLER